MCRDVGCLSFRSYGTIRICFYLLIAGRGSLAGPFLFIGPFRRLKGPPDRDLLCCLVWQALEGHALQALCWSAVSTGV